MFENLARLLPRESVAEERLRQMVDAVFQRTVFVIDFPPHGRRAERDERVLAGFDRLTRLLEAGGEHLDRARAASAEQDRAAAARARALAAFARSRPAGELDRPDDEIGAAAAATRAARPRALMEVSEWAVDEVMVALSVTSRTAARLLDEAVTLDELLPATLDAAESGAIT